MGAQQGVHLAEITHLFKTTTLHIITFLSRGSSLRHRFL